MSKHQDQKRHHDPKIRGLKLDLIDSFYRASDLLVASHGQNKAEATAQAYWAGKQVEKCLKSEAEIHSLTASLEPFVRNSQK